MYGPSGVTAVPRSQDAPDEAPRSSSPRSRQQSGLHFISHCPGPSPLAIGASRAGRRAHRKARVKRADSCPVYRHPRILGIRGKLATGCLPDEEFCIVVAWSIAASDHSARLELSENGPRQGEQLRGRQLRQRFLGSTEGRTIESGVTHAACINRGVLKCPREGAPLVRPRACTRRGAPAKRSRLNV